MSVYNGERYVAKAIESILKQTFVDFEFIILNDGATDDSAKIIDGYHDPRIRYFEQENMGLARSLNRGISLSRGEYIARMDADDIALPTRLAKQVEAMDSHPNCALLGTACYVVDDNDRMKFIMRHPSEDVHLRWLILFDSPFVHSSVIFRHSAFEAVGPYNTESDFHVEDYDLWSRFLSQYRAANLEEPLLLYRHNPQGISQTRRSSQEAQSVAVSAGNMSQLLDNSSFTFERAQQVRYLRGNWPDHWRKDDIEGAIDNLSLIHTLFLAKHKDALESHPSVARAIKNDVNQKLLMASIALATCGARSSGFRTLRRASRSETRLALRPSFWATMALLILGPRFSSRLVSATRRWRLRHLGLGDHKGSKK